MPLSFCPCCFLCLRHFPYLSAWQPPSSKACPGFSQAHEGLSSTTGWEYAPPGPGTGHGRTLSLWLGHVLLIPQQLAHGGHIVGTQQMLLEMWYTGNSYPSRMMMYCPALRWAGVRVKCVLRSPDTPGKERREMSESFFGFTTLPRLVLLY